MLRPYEQVHRIEEVDAVTLWNQGFRAIILDLDNTLLAYGSEELPQERRSWIEAAKAQGFALIILSNNFPDRVRRLAQLLDIMAIPNALKPLPHSFIRALLLLKMPPRKCVIIGDQLLTDLLGASFFGIKGILTEPIVARDFPLTRVLRFIEKRILRRTYPKE